MPGKSNDMNPVLFIGRKDIIFCKVWQALFCFYFK